MRARNSLTVGRVNGTVSGLDQTRSWRTFDVANIKSAKKRIRQNERRRLRNRAIRSRIRSAVKVAREAVGAKAQAAPAAGPAPVHDAIRILDKAVSKGVIHPNTAARKKSALARQLVPAH